MRKLYYQIPMPLKRLAFSLIPYQLIAGKNYTNTLKLCKYLDHADTGEIIAFQEKQLKKILDYAVNKVPFYKPYKNRLHNVNNYRDALNYFPVISKKIVQEKFHDFISDDIASIRYNEARTGGSSGNQLLFYQDRVMYSIEMAFMHSQWQRVGYTPNCRKATFRGVTFEHIGDKTFWQYNPIHNELQFSPFHMSDENLFYYVERLKHYRPFYLHGYPSALTNLAHYIIRNNLQNQISPLKAVLCCSEECSMQQRKTLEQAFCCRIYTWYGHSERVVLAGECEESSVYHALPGYGICELLSSSGQSCSVGETGEIVGTGFWNFSMPLIRYNTEDAARFLASNCACKRCTMLFDQVESRWKSGVLSKNNTLISAAALNVHEAVFDHAARFQYYQEKPGKLDILIVPTEKWVASDTEKILELHRKKVGDELDIKVIMTDHIPLTPAGKQMTIRLGYKPEGL